MEARKMTQQITLQTVSLTQDSELNPVPAYTDWLTVWAEPLEKTGREFFRLQTVNSEITEAFRIRYIRGVDPRQRIKFRGKYLEIVNVDNAGERNIELILTAKAVI